MLFHLTIAPVQYYMDAPCYMPSPGPVINISTLPQESDNSRSTKYDCKSTIDHNMYYIKCNIPYESD